MTFEVLEVGDLVTPVSINCISKVGKNNIGTITHRWSDAVTAIYEIQWEHAGKGTYRDTAGPNQWNVRGHEVKLYKSAITLLDPNTKYKKVCEKINKMQAKRKVKGYAI